MLSKINIDKWEKFSKYFATKDIAYKFLSKSSDKVVSDFLYTQGYFKRKPKTYGTVKAIRAGSKDFKPLKPSPRPRKRKPSAIRKQYPKGYIYSKQKWSKYRNKYQLKGNALPPSIFAQICNVNAVTGYVRSTYQVTKFKKSLEKDIKRIANILLRRKNNYIVLYVKVPYDIFDRLNNYIGSDTRHYHYRFSNTNMLNVLVETILIRMDKELMCTGSIKFQVTNFGVYIYEK